MSAGTAIATATITGHTAKQPIRQAKARPARGIARWFPIAPVLNNRPAAQVCASLFCSSLLSSSLQTINRRFFVFQTFKQASGLDHWVGFSATLLRAESTPITLLLYQAARYFKVTLFCLPLRLDFLTRLNSIFHCSKPPFQFLFQQIVAILWIRFNPVVDQVSLAKREIYFNRSLRSLFLLSEFNDLLAFPEHHRLIFLDGLYRRLIHLVTCQVTFQIPHS